MSKVFVFLGFSLSTKQNIKPSKNQWKKYFLMLSIAVGPWQLTVVSGTNWRQQTPKSAIFCGRVLMPSCSSREYKYSLVIRAQFYSFETITMKKANITLTTNPRKCLCSFGWTQIIKVYEREMRIFLYSRVTSDARE